MKINILYPALLQTANLEEYDKLIINTAKAAAMTIKTSKAAIKASNAANTANASNAANLPALVAKAAKAANAVAKAASNAAANASSNAANAVNISNIANAAAKVLTNVAANAASKAANAVKAAKKCKASNVTKLAANLAINAADNAAMNASNAVNAVNTANTVIKVVTNVIANINTKLVKVPKTFKPPKIPKPYKIANAIKIAAKAANKIAVKAHKIANAVKIADKAAVKAAAKAAVKIATNDKVAKPIISAKINKYNKRIILVEPMKSVKSNSWFDITQRKNNEIKDEYIHVHHEYKYFNTKTIVLDLDDKQKTIIKLWLDDIIDVYNLTNKYIKDNMEYDTFDHIGIENKRKCTYLIYKNFNTLVNTFNLQKLLGDEIAVICKKNKLPKRQAEFEIKHCVTMYKSAHSNFIRQQKIDIYK